MVILLKRSEKIIDDLDDISHIRYGRAHELLHPIPIDNDCKTRRWATDARYDAKNGSTGGDDIARPITPGILASPIDALGDSSQLFDALQGGADSNHFGRFRNIFGAHFHIDS
jgi:hypothetical protein